MDSWELLLAKALACLDSARTQGLTIGEWTFGGGTALMCHFDHRFSRDIDIFVPDAACRPASTTLSLGAQTITMKPLTT